MAKITQYELLKFLDKENPKLKEKIVRELVNKMFGDKK